MPDRRQIYPDRSATPPLSPEPFEVMIPYLKGRFGNPSSIRRFSLCAKRRMEEIRKNTDRRLSPA